MMCVSRFAGGFLFVACLFGHDWLIVPGVRVGPITAKSTEASLRADFGSAAVVRGNIRTGRTSSTVGFEIFRGRAGESIAVILPRKENGLWWPLQVIPCYGSTDTQCRWRTASGVRVGLSLADLQRLNGKPFSLYPSADLDCWSDAWWDGGRLEAELGEDIELYFDDPGYAFEAGGAFVRSNETPLSENPARINRMLVFLLSGNRAPPLNDWIIRPGERFGPIPMHASVEPLRETLGTRQVHRVISQADEGLGSIPGISIFGGSAEGGVLLRRDGNLICGETLEYAKCRWKIEGGVPLEASVKALEQLNGRAFVFNGCCFDLGGIVTSWEDGRLAKLRGVRFAVSCEGEMPERLRGEVQVRSDDLDIRNLKCSVKAISF